MQARLTYKPGREGINLLETDYRPLGKGKRAFWPLGDERLIENALRRAGARSVINDDFTWSLVRDWLVVMAEKTLSDGGG